MGVSVGVSDGVGVRVSVGVAGKSVSVGITVDGLRVGVRVGVGVCDGVGNGKRVIRLASTPIDNDPLTAWLIEAAVRYMGKPISLPSLQSLPVLFPFTLTRPLSYVVSTSTNLALRSDGPSNQIVDLIQRL